MAAEGLILLAAIAAEEARAHRTQRGGRVREESGCRSAGEETVPLDEASATSCSKRTEGSSKRSWRWDSHSHFDSNSTSTGVAATGCDAKDVVDSIPSNPTRTCL